MQLLLIVGVLLSVPAGGATGEPIDEPPPLSVLYLGNASTPRAKQFMEFLDGRFQSVRVVNRNDFDAKSAADFDVVLLDWSQSDVDLSKMGEIQSPLGPRDEWTKPTVLLGSAGLLIASPWLTTGSSG